MQAELGSQQSFRYGPFHAIGDVLLLLGPFVLVLLVPRRVLVYLPQWWSMAWIAALALLLLYRARIKVNWLPRPAEVGRIVRLTAGSFLPFMVLAVALAHIPGIRVPDYSTAAIWFQSVVLVPFGEELFFRGYLHTRLLQHDAARWRLGRFSVSRAALVSGSLFGAIHILNYLWGGMLDPIPVAAHLGFAAVYGVVAAEILDRTGGLLGPILLHAMINGGSALYIKWLAARAAAGL